MSDWTWNEIEQYLQEGRRTVLVPIGSTEQHGPAGPLGVDTLVAIGLAEDAAQATGALVAPPIWVGDSFHHSAFPGTLWLRASTLIALITDIGASLAEAGFHRQIWINGHKGSNLPALTIALRELHQYRYPATLFAVVDPLFLGRQAAAVRQEPEHHAGALELSEVMYRFPGKVRSDRLTDAHSDFAAIGGGYLSDDLFGAAGLVDIPWNSREERRFAPTGSIGSSRTASVELGRAFHEPMVARLAEFVRWFEAYQGPLGVIEAGPSPTESEGGA